MNPNRKAFLDVIAHSEIGPKMLAESDNGYDVIVGSRPGKMILCKNYYDHPNQKIWFPKLRNPATGKMGLYSTAAGRYQIIYPTWRMLKEALGLKDFSPFCQDEAAIALIRGRHALADVDAGHIDEALFKCRREWASLPGAGYGQHENILAGLQDVYLESGGVLGS